MTDGKVLSAFTISARVGLVSRACGMCLCGCWVPHSPGGFPLSVAIREGIQRGEMEANQRKSSYSPYVVYTTPSEFGHPTFCICTGWNGESGATGTQKSFSF